MAKGDWLKKEIDNFFTAFKNIMKKEPQSTEPLPSTEQRAQNEQLVRRLKELEAKRKEREALPQPDYETLFAPTLGLAPKPNPEITDEDIADRAETALLPDYTKKVDKVELDTFASLANMDKKITSADIKYNEDIRNLDRAFGELMERQVQNMVKQGIIHSSISANTFTDTAKERERTLAERAEKYTATLHDYNKAIELIEQNRVYALQEYELKFAADLEGKIIALKKERDNLIAAVNTYNAKIIKDEAAYQKYREDTISKMEAERHAAQEKKDKETAKREQVTGYTGPKAVEMEARYRYALEFYNSLPKDIALKLIEENSGVLKSTLGFYFADLSASQLKRSA